MQAATQRHFPLTVTGLPAVYAPGAQHEITLNWPEFSQRWRELRPDPMVPAPLGTPGPRAGLITELVAESGAASGTIVINQTGASASELCEATRPGLQPRLGVRLYQVRAGLDPLLIRPDPNGVMRCESSKLGQRCLIALTACGAQQVRFTWTAPTSWQGPIWFSSGFVVSEAESATPEQDSVHETAVPILQAGTEGGVYKDTLQRGCSAARGAAGGVASASAAASLLTVLIARGRRRQRRGMV